MICADFMDSQIPTDLCDCTYIPRFMKSKQRILLFVIQPYILSHKTTLCKHEKRLTNIIRNGVQRAAAKYKHKLDRAAYNVSVDFLESTVHQHI